MSHHLSFTQIGALCGYATGMAAGQIMFKLASVRLASETTAAGRLISLLHNGFFLGALAIYSGLSVWWVLILRVTPLSKAYPFAALSFALVPILSSVIFLEPLSPRLMLGFIVILSGLVLVAG
jgi:drug/metabolite transporter (DMT)-like permease